MKMIWHIMKKDLRAVWPLWLAWMGLIAVRIPLLVYYLNIADERMLQSMSLVAGCASMADVIMVFALVRSVVHEDPQVGDKAFWITRPVKGWQLLMAKAATSFLVCVISPLVLLIPTWLGFGFTGTDIAGALVFHAWTETGLVIAALLLAAVTQRGNAFWLVLVSTSIGVFILALATTETFHIRLFASNDVLWGAVIFGVIVVVFGIWQQFIKRRVAITWCCFSVAALIIGLALPRGAVRLMAEGEHFEKIEQPLKLSWKGGGLTLVAKDQPYVIGSIEVIKGRTKYSVGDLHYLKGAWVDADGRTEPAYWMDWEGKFSVRRNVSPNGTEDTLTETRYQFPVVLSASAHSGNQKWQQSGFVGQVTIEFRQYIKITETKLVAGAKVRAADFFSRIVKVRTFEKAVEVSLVEASPTDMEHFHTRILGAPEWTAKEGHGYTTTQLLGVRIKYSNFTFSAPRKERQKTEDGTPVYGRYYRGVETHEDPAEKGWRIEWDCSKAAGYAVYELKADQLTIKEEGAK